MGDVDGISVFLPYKVLDNLSCAYLFGSVIKNKSSIFMNSLISVATDKSLNDLLNLHQLLNQNSNCESDLQFIGIVYESRKKITIFSQVLETYYKNAWFILRVDIRNNSFHLEKCYSFDNRAVNFIFYDSFELLSSHLLFSIITNNNKKNLVSFLFSSLTNNEQFSSFLNNSNDNRFLVSTFALDKNNHGSFIPYCSYIKETVTFMNQFCAASWWLQIFLKIVRISHIGRQILQRTSHINEVILNKKTEHVDLKRKNLMFAILFDVICGWLITFFILKLDLPVLFLENTIVYTNNIVRGLKKLIFWLMGVPAGLKLNIPLNSALGQFFLYHIYLWEAYMTIIVPVFQIIFKISFFIGIFGLTFVLSLLSDIMSLTSIHVFCFYGYATRLYGYQMSCLSSLWRLFRGKKWNPLRQRVDSHSYDVHQLYLGTLLFTVLLFLLPTVFVYYLVFMTLRVLVLAVQGLISKCIDVLSVLPFYTIILRLLGSPITNGDIFFSVYNSEATLVLSMKFVQTPIFSVIRSTLPEVKKLGKAYGWKELISNILTGNIIYPI